MPPTLRRRRDSPSSDGDSEEDSGDEGCSINGSGDEGCSINSSGDEEEDSSSTSTDAQLRLAAAGLYHLQSLHLILCTTCKVALSPRHAASHASRKHSRNVKGLQEVLNALELCKPCEVELVALPADTPHLLRAPLQRSTVPSFIINRRPM